MGKGQGLYIIMPSEDIEACFPGLQTTEYAIKSQETASYNCIAWAAGNVKNPWWPTHLHGYYWPPSVHREETLEGFIDAFRIYGYMPCDGDNLELGFEKVAIYVSGDGTPTHAARQLNSGKWTSKLGDLEDIEHSTLAALEGAIYGRVAQVLKRPIAKRKKKKRSKTS